MAQKEKAAFKNSLLHAWDSRINADRNSTILSNYKNFFFFYSCIKYKIMKCWKWDQGRKGQIINFQEKKKDKVF